MLISFEGIDGSGKSTQVRLVAERLSAEGHTPLLVREPGGAVVAERIRTLLLDPALDIKPFAELLLFAAARAQLVAERIVPALEAGQYVLCDRFFDSSIAYQGEGRGLQGGAWMRQFQERVTGGVVPVRTYWVDVPLAEARRRQAHRDSTPDRMEAADRSFYDRVIRGYADLAAAEPERILRLDGMQPVETIHARVWDDLCTLRADGTAFAGSR
ncbi:MAG: dTMP kinase [Bacteroidota bacterium]